MGVKILTIQAFSIFSWVLNLPPGSPHLKDANPEIVDMYTSRSTPVMTKAQLNHADDIVKLKSPWWKKLWDGDEQQVIDISKKNEELNF